MTEWSPTVPTDPEGSPASDLCAPFITNLPISGASVTVIVASGARLSLCSSDATAARVDELQFELGEGPQWSTAQSGEIVSVTDVASTGHDDWPVFGAALRELPVGALFCVPIRMGAVTLGVVTLYSAARLRLTSDQHITALAIASAIAGTAASQALQSATEETPLESATMPASRREVHQATGMMLVQLDTSATIAYSRLQAYAFANGQTVHEVARDVVGGLLDFKETGP